MQHAVFLYKRDAGRKTVAEWLWRCVVHERQIYMLMGAMGGLGVDSLMMLALFLRGRSVTNVSEHITFCTRNAGVRDNIIMSPHVRIMHFVSARLCMCVMAPSVHKCTQFTLVSRKSGLMLMVLLLMHHRISEQIMRDVHCALTVSAITAMCVCVFDMCESVGWAFWGV